MSETETIANASRNGDYVFERATQLDANHVLIGVEPEARIAEGVLHPGRSR